MGGLTLRFLQTGTDTGGELDMVEMTVNPDARMPVPRYYESWDETVFGRTGVTTWRIDGRDVAVEPGESVLIQRGVVHGFGNNSADAGTCLCILTPGVLRPAYFREMRGLLDGGAPDPTRMREVMLRHGLVPAA